MKKFVLIFISIFFLICSTSYASKYFNPISSALKRGEEYWKVIPCNGKIKVISSAIQPSNLEAGAEQKGIENGEFTVQAWTNISTCTITINTNKWLDLEVDRLNFQWFCDMITHELGHLPPLNHPDDGQTNPASIEYPLLEPGTPNFNSVPQCKLHHPRP